MSLEDKLTELTQLGQEIGLESRVCLTHEKINICRKGNREGGCVWSEDSADVTRIQAMHLRQPCGRCDADLPMTCTCPPAATLPGLLMAVEAVDKWLDSALSPDYEAQPLAHTWARVTKVCEEAGEVWRALSKVTGENPRKGVCGTEDDLLGELADTAAAAIFAIQHRTKDTAVTWAVLSAAVAKAAERAATIPKRQEG